MWVCSVFQGAPLTPPQQGGHYSHSLLTDRWGGGSAPLSAPLILLASLPLSGVKCSALCRAPVTPGEGRQSVN